MHDFLFQIQRSSSTSLQSQIRQVLVSAILAGQLPADERLPSTREMAKTLGVSRNTVLQAYLCLVDDGYLLARDRSGYYVNGEIKQVGLEAPLNQADVRAQAQQGVNAKGMNWRSKFRVQPAHQHNIQKPSRWHDYPYPFNYGQIDHKHFPIAEWRDCSRQGLGTKWLDVWTKDAQDQDDPMLVEQIRTRLLPRRGILASTDEILITMGAQNALYLLASLLVTDHTTVGFEEPGYPDARNIFDLKTKRMLPISVDEQGMVVDSRLDMCDMVFVTPSHQFPTTVTMTRGRREALMAKAIERSMIIIEDDYEFEANYLNQPTPALKSMDRGGNVIYVGSLSKSFFPGLRIGFLVGPREVIDEARALRRLMVRHPPCNNQRTSALFLSLGHHDALLHRLNRIYRSRWQEMGHALKKHMPNSSRAPSFGGSCYWVRGPDGLDANQLAIDALKEGIVLEPGGIFFCTPGAPKNYFRLGFSSIEQQQIEPGIRLLAQIIDRQTNATAAAPQYERSGP